MSTYWNRRGAGLAGLLSLALVTFTVAQQAADPPAERAAPSADGGAPPRHPGAAFAGLFEALKNSPGCYGIDTAQASSGKQVVFAWFKDREALLDWYYSDAHQQVMALLGDDAITSDPLEGVAEGEGPLMCVAAVTWKKPGEQARPADEGDYQPSIPISQISIEVFRPVTSAKAFNGAFSPAEALLPEPAAAKSN